MNRWAYFRGWAYFQRDYYYVLVIELYVDSYLFSAFLQEGKQGSSSWVVGGETDWFMEGHTPHHVHYVGMGTMGHHFGLMDVVHEVLSIFLTGHG